MPRPRFQRGTNLILVDDWAFLTKTAAYTLLEGDEFILADATAGDFTVTLMSPADLVGQVVAVKLISAANNVTVATPAAETIDGGATWVSTAQWHSAAFVTDGTNYYVLSEVGGA